MNGQLATRQQVVEAIKAGKRMLLAGHEAALKDLPAGKWIGGTIPYFMAKDGARFDRERIFVTEVPRAVTEISIRAYAADALEKIPQDAPSNGVSFIILPASSPAHVTFAQNAPSYPGLFLKPLVGWIAGMPVEEIGKVSAKVIDGESCKFDDQRAMVMHCTLPKGKAVKLDIVNIFTPGDGDDIEFDALGFSAQKCRVGGKVVDFAKYIAEKKIDTQLPLVANYHGAMINTSFQSVDAAGNKVDFYAPVFPGITYKVARPVGDYAAEFGKHIPEGIAPDFACNCILNYLFGKLEGKKCGAIVGPITFGEVAYQLLNQTMVYMEIRDV